MWSLHEAKNRFSAVVAAAMAGRPQPVSRRGKPAVVVVDQAQWARMQALAGEARGGFAAHLQAFPGGGAEIERGRAVPRDVEF